MYSLSGDQNELNTPSATSDDTESVLTTTSYVSNDNVSQEFQTLIPTESAETSFCVDSQSTAVVTSPNFDTSFKNNFDISFYLPPKRIKTSSVFDDVSHI